MIDDCCGAGAIDEAVICALIGRYPVITAEAAQSEGALAIVKRPDGSCARVSGVEYNETPWIGVSDSGTLTITPGDNPAGPTGNGHAPRFAVSLPPETAWNGTGGGLVVVTPGGTLGHAPTISVSCEAVQACVGPLIPGGVTGGCGVNVVGTQVNLRTGSWTYPCADTNGAPVVCAADGILRTAPEHTCVASSRLLTGTTFGIVVAPIVVETAGATVSINNPSPCRTMIATAQYTAAFEDSNAGGWAAGAASIHITNSGLGGAYSGSYRFFLGDCAVIAGRAAGMHVNTANNDVGVIAAGGSATATITTQIDVQGGFAGALDAQQSVFLMGCTQ